MKIKKTKCLNSIKDLRLSPLALFVGMSLFSGVLHAENYFNPAFLSDGTNQVADLSTFETDSGQHRVFIV